MKAQSLISAFALIAPSFASHSLRSKRDTTQHHNHLRHVHNSESEASSSRDVPELQEDFGVTYANGTNSYDLQKRQTYTGRGTFYYTGLGACGITNSDTDLIVALNTPQYDEYGGGYPGPQCWKWITVQANGVTVSGIQITDECPSCGWGSLDMSPGLFQHFAPESVGVLSITWWFDGSSGGSSSQAAQVTSSSTYTPPPSSTYTPPTTTSSSQWTPTTTTTSWTPTTTSSSTTWTPSTTSTWSSSSSSTWSTTSTWNATTTSHSTISFNATTNPFVVASSYNSTTGSSTATSTAADASSTGGAGGDAAPEDTTGNLQAINGLVTNYGQIVVVAAGGKSP